MTDRTLDVRLQELIRRHGHTDPLLSLLVNVTSRGLGPGPQFGVVLVTAAGRFQGIPATGERFAEALDDDARWYADVMRRIATNRGAGEAELAPIDEDWSVFRRHVEDDARDEQRVIDYLESVEDPALPTPEFPDDLLQAAVAFKSPMKAISLHEAHFLPNGGEWTEVGVCRVVLNHVIAWWTFRLGAPEEVEAARLGDR